MKSEQALRKRDRLKALLEWKRKDTSSPTPPQIATVGTSTVTSINSPSLQGASGATLRAAAQYLKAAKALEEVVNGCKSGWGSFDFPELKGEPINPADSQFKHKIDMVLEAQKGTLKDQTAWEKCKHTVQCVFTALSPFAKNFLTIAAQAQSIADKEVGRKDDVEKMLNFMYQQLEQLEILDMLPEDLQQRESVVNCAIDVRSASMIYLAVNIRHQATPGGDIGKVFKTLLVGDEKITNATDYLRICVDAYCRALNNIHTRISIKSYELHIEDHKLLKELAAVNLQDRTERNQIEDKFLVPYQENPRFIGRMQFLQTLKEKLSAKVSRRFNHRVALHGMGGIGKTQCALGYAYANKTEYDRIYWISAVAQTSLLSGYQNIAKHARLPGLQSATPVEIADAVLSWLKVEQKWLLVLDNLDDIKVAGRFLPENGPEKHTLITTRDPNANSILAEPLEVPLLDPEDAIDLLSTLSEIDVAPGLEERKQADEIVKELGYLPLAIEQAGAFVKAVGDFNTYSEEYKKNRQELHRWVPNGPYYPYTVATTWSISFKVIQNDNPLFAKLLRLLSFLNPDGILIEFLTVGASVLEDDLQQLVSSRIEMTKALLELEKFSLIKWNRQQKTIQIHRLVQMVVNDEMPDAERKSIATTIINLCNQVFPNEVTNETRPLCRTYQSQVVDPLLRINSIRTEEAAEIKVRVGKFLLDDGKYNDSEKLLSQAAEICVDLFGKDHIVTLTRIMDLALTYFHQGHLMEAAKLLEELIEKQKQISGEDAPEMALKCMNNLALTYTQQGRLMEAAKLQEEVLEKGKRVLDGEHPDRLTNIHNLAWTYFQQGRLVEATKLQEEMLEMRKRVSGEEHPNTLMAIHNLAQMYTQQGRLVEATKLQEVVLEKWKRISGEDHPSTLVSINNLASTYALQGRLIEAEKLLEKVVEKLKQISGEEHPDTLAGINNLAWMYTQQGRLVEAVSLYEEAVEKDKRILGETHPITLDATSNMHKAQEKLEKAARTAGGERSKEESEILKMQN